MKGLWAAPLMVTGSAHAHKKYSLSSFKNRDVVMHMQLGLGPIKMQTHGSAKACAASIAILSCNKTTNADGSTHSFIRVVLWHILKSYNTGPEIQGSVRPHAKSTNRGTSEPGIQTPYRYRLLNHLFPESAVYFTAWKRFTLSGSWARRF